MTPVSKKVQAGDVIVFISCHRVLYATVLHAIFLHCILVYHWIMPRHFLHHSNFLLMLGKKKEINEPNSLAPGWIYQNFIDFYKQFTLLKICNFQLWNMPRFLQKLPIDDMFALIQVMAWWQIWEKPLLESMMILVIPYGDTDLDQHLLR